MNPRLHFCLTWGLVATVVLGSTTLAWRLETAAGGASLQARQQPAVRGHGEGRVLMARAMSLPSAAASASGRDTLVHLARQQ